MSRIDQILAEFKELESFTTFLAELTDLDPGIIDAEFAMVIASEYEAWYSQALPLVKLVLPAREQDFRSIYRHSSSDEFNTSGSSITQLLNSAIEQVIEENEDGESVVVGDYGLHSDFILLARRHGAILRTAERIAPTVLADLEIALRLDLFESNLETASELLRAKQIRAAGAMAGVVLEKHLKTVCERRAIQLPRKDAVISEMNDALRTNGIYDVIMWRLIQRLADIRNYCAHSKDREPTAEEVADLIAGAQRVIMDVF